MDRQIVYPGQILPETSLLQMTKDAMIGTAKLASALLGTNTYASGFAVTPTGPASLQVLYAPGEIYSLATIDALAFSTLPADTTHSILKQGILLDGGTLNCPAPGTTGQSINYLVQVTYQDSDASPVLLPYYNSANPAMPFSGAGNNGLTQNTVRKGVAVVSVKAGASATTGTQVTPAPDVGYIGLFAVTVAFGQTTITSGNIAQLATAPLINSTLHGLSPTFTVSPVIPAATASNQAMQLGQAVGRYLGTQIITASGTVTKTAGATKWRVRGGGGGGQGGGTAATSASQVSTGGGGSTGSLAEAVFDVSAITTASAVIGLGGSTGVAGANGVAGGTTSLTMGSNSLTIPGGPGGVAGAAVSSLPNEGGAAGAFGTPPSHVGALSFIGTAGGGATTGVNLSLASAQPGLGGSSPFGFSRSSGNSSAVGNSAGGSGARSLVSTGANNGPSGSPGFLIIDEYA